MPNIVSSSFVAFTQANGTKTVHETHTDLAGAPWEIVYTISASADLNTAMNAHAVDLGLNLKNSEVAANTLGVTTLGSLFPPTFVYSTIAENAAALRAAYLIATNSQAMMIGDFLSTLTSAQLQAAFNLTALQVTTLRTTKLTPAALLAAQVHGTTGQ